jgi:hypothetical protein
MLYDNFVSAKTGRWDWEKLETSIADTKKHKDQKSAASDGDLSSLMQNLHMDTK